MVLGEKLIDIYSQIEKKGDEESRLAHVSDGSGSVNVAQRGPDLNPDAKLL